MSHSMYSKILLSSRLRPSESGHRTIVLESESDRARLIFSAPFRRLQQKAQVFSLEENAAVRSRLTHSIEVAQYGRFIAEQIAIWLQAENLASSDECRAFVNFVETACLMHDLGNPPFGHFGEAAIQAWFDKQGRNCFIKAVECVEDTNDPRIERAISDFLEFDGNCQGLRIATRLQWNKDEFGLNLTHTTFASFLKYLRSPRQSNQSVKTPPFSKKPGFFNSEKKRVHEIWEQFGYSPENPQRFPLTYVMEAADDIAYCISDLEDSLEKGLLDERLIFRELCDRWQKVDVESRETCELSKLLVDAAKNAGTPEFTFLDFRTKLAINLTRYAAEQYKARHHEVLRGACDSLLPAQSNAGRFLDLLKTYCRATVYCRESVQRVELAGYAAIRGLLDHFGDLLSCSKDRFQKSLDYQNNRDDSGKPILTEKKLLALFPEKHVKVYEHRCSEIDTSQSYSADEMSIEEWIARAHLVTDFISGMTDHFAVATYQMLSGIRTD